MEHFPPLRGRPRAATPRGPPRKIRGAKYKIKTRQMAERNFWKWTSTSWKTTGRAYRNGFAHSSSMRTTKYSFHVELSGMNYRRCSAWVMTTKVLSGIGGHAYAPASWLAENYPHHAEKIKIMAISAKRRIKTKVST